jgi:hypothetical protein
LLINKTSFLLFLLVSVNCFSQNDVNNDIRDVTKLTFFGPGISYEKRIGKLQSLTAQALLSPEIYIGYSSALGNTSGIDAYPALGLQYKYYYNIPKRNSKEKRTQMNSANYLSAMTEIYFYKDRISVNGKKDLRSSKVMGIVWGLQRNYRSRFSLDLSLGLGYIFTKQTAINDAGEYITENSGDFTNVGQISLGFWVNKRN